MQNDASTTYKINSSTAETSDAAPEAFKGNYNNNNKSNIPGRYNSFISLSISQVLALFVLWTVCLYFFVGNYWWDNVRVPLLKEEIRDTEVLPIEEEWKSKYVSLETRLKTLKDDNDRLEWQNQEDVNRMQQALVTASSQLKVETEQEKQ